MKTLVRKRAGNVPRVTGLCDWLRACAADRLFVVMLVGEGREPDFAFADEDRHFVRLFADEFNATELIRPCGAVAIVLTWRQAQDAFPKALRNPPDPKWYRSAQG